LPRSVKANGWLLFDQGKMSKSRGNVVRAETVLEVLGADAMRYFLLREIPFGQDGGFSFEALVQRYNADLANGYGNLVSRVVNMVHKYFGGVVPEVGAETPAEAALRECAVRTIAAFGPAFDELNFSEALKSLWLLVAETDGYLTANAPWKRPTDRPEAEHVALQARVLATAAEAIRIITALVYPILPVSAAKVWLQLGQGEIAEAAKNAFLTHLAWGGLRAGTKFAEPAPLFPRAEKDAVDRMQKIEEENSNSVIEAAGGSAANTEPSAPPNDASTALTATAEKRNPEGDGGFNPRVKPIQSKGALAPEVRTLENTSSASPATNSSDAAKPQLAPPQVALSPQGSSSTASAPAILTPAAPEIAAEPTHITIDDFIKVDLRVAQILVAERVPKADKLLRLEVDLGYEKRQILAGIAQYYEPEKLVGRKIIIVANLAPRKMRGLESNGMLLAASLPPDGAPVLAGFLEDVPLGARLK
ncbi:MAG: methionine--tRNA ligase subunit beta, partial [Terracidiphilus sp.]